MNTESVTTTLAMLSIDPANVRKTGRGEEPKFAASIRKRGVIEPMIVRRDGGRFLIINGGERFTALQYLMKKGEKAAGIAVTKDFPVKVEIADYDERDARATSLATNLIRSDMHPVDEFEAFAARIKDGATVDELAAEYARTVPQIRQALSLAAIAPEIRKAWREGTIDGVAAEAYAQTKDLEHQARVFKKLKKNAGEEWAVREEIEGDGRRGMNALLKFVGRKEYEAAGHHVNASLFSDDERHSESVDNVPALKAMAERKLDEEAVRLKKDGWAWVIRKDEAPKDLYAWRKLPIGNPTKEQKALAGCTIEVNWQGGLEVERGYVKPGVNIKVEKTPAQKAAARNAGPTKPAGLSAALAQRLSEALTKAAAATVATGDQDTVLRLALAGMICSSSFTNESPVCLSNTGAGAKEDDVEYDFDEQLARLRKMARPALLPLFAKVVGSSLDLRSASAARALVKSEGVVEDEGIAALVDLIPQKVLQAALLKEFDAVDYFENAPGAMALAALRDIGMNPLKNAKKAALAKQATDAAKNAGWLPPQLRTEGYAGPKAKPVKKAVSRKKRL